MTRFLIVFILLVPAVGVSQVLDDSTELVYGPSTTIYYTEEELFRNEVDSLRPDTLLNNNHHYEPVRSSRYELEDLGVVGTALRDRYYQLPDQIGATSGYNGYNYFFYDPDRIRYYDTKSPYTLLQIVLGGKGRDRTTVSISRNINPQLNIGFDIRKWIVRRQIQRASRRDRWHESTQYDFYTSYRTKNDKYHLLANFSRTRHIVTETGGTDSTSEGGFFDYDNVQPLLSDAKSYELKRQYHLYHQYKFWPLAQLYHRMDRTLQWNDYKSTSANSSYYNALYIDSTATDDRLKFETFRNEVGIKGKYRRLFYNFYYAGRQVNILYRHADSMDIDFPTSFWESYAGFNINVPLPGQLNVKGSGAYLQGGRYRIKAGIEGRGFEGHVQQMRYAVPVLYQQYLGNHDQWKNDFEDPFNTEIGGSYTLRTGKVMLKPSARWQNLSRHVYMAQDTLPAQAGTDINILGLGFDWKLNFLRNVWFEGRARYHTISSDSIQPVRIPELTLLAQLYYAQTVFGNIDIQLGTEVFWQSDYYAYGYRPSVQQYFLQDDFVVEAFPRADVFLNAKISRAKIFLRINNLVHWVTSSVGEVERSYFTAPGYISYDMSFDFGVRWMFFD